MKDFRNENWWIDVEVENDFQMCWMILEYGMCNKMYRNLMITKRFEKK